MLTSYDIGQCARSERATVMEMTCRKKWAKIESMVRGNVAAPTGWDSDIAFPPRWCEAPSSSAVRLV
jgi:hypothetical protein